MLEDDIYFGSSRMVELLLGSYEPAVDFTMAGDRTPAEGRPLHADWVHHLGLVGWRSGSDEAARRKSMHFRSLVAKASLQLPGDRPGVVQVGCEGSGGDNEDGRRHAPNRREIATFQPGATGLRMVYGNYSVPELVTARNESAAVTETLAWHPVGRCRRARRWPATCSSWTRMANRDRTSDGGNRPQWFARTRRQWRVAFQRGRMRCLKDGWLRRMLGRGPRWIGTPATGHLASIQRSRNHFACSVATGQSRPRAWMWDRCVSTGRAIAGAMFSTPVTRQEFVAAKSATRATIQANACSGEPNVSDATLGQSRGRSPIDMPKFMPCSGRTLKTTSGLNRSPSP